MRTFKPSVRRDSEYRRFGSCQDTEKHLVRGPFAQRTGEAAAVRERGELAGRMDILRGKETDQDVVVPTQLVIRGSTAPPHS